MLVLKLKVFAIASHKNFINNLNNEYSTKTGNYAIYTYRIF